MNQPAPEGTLGWFIDTVLLGDLRHMILDCGLHYLGFGVMASGIEFMGACLDQLPLDQDGQSKARFNCAVRELFDNRYRQYVEPKDDDYSLYRNLRCGMAHIVRPHGKVGFTNRAESARFGTSHLGMSDGRLVLVSEDLYDDFAAAARILQSRMEGNELMKRLSDPYLAIPPSPPIS